MPRLRPAPKASVDKPDSTESVSTLFENKPETTEPELHENPEPAPEGPVEIEVAPKEAKVEKVEEPKEDPSLALQKQLDQLKKSEELQRIQNAQIIRERDEARRLAAESQRKAVQADYQTVSSGLEAAKERLESAKRDLRTAETSGDIEAKIDAQDRLADAKYDFRIFQEAKGNLDNQIEVERTTPKVEPKVEQNQLPESARQYIGRHPELLQDNRKNAKLQNLHFEAIDSGNEAYSSAYYEFLDIGLGYKKVEPKVEPQEQQRTNIVSAPVSREVPNGGTGSRSSDKITLTPLQREAAALSKITEAEYARQLKKLQEAKANGQYTGGQ